MVEGSLGTIVYWSAFVEEMGSYLFLALDALVIDRL